MGLFLSRYYKNWGYKLSYQFLIYWRHSCWSSSLFIRTMTHWKSSIFIRVLRILSSILSIIPMIWLILAQSLTRTFWLQSAWIYYRAGIKTVLALNYHSIWCFTSLIYDFWLCSSRDISEYFRLTVLNWWLGRVTRSHNN